MHAAAGDRPPTAVQAAYAGMGIGPMSFGTW